MDNTQKTVNKYAERAAKSKSGFAMLSLILLLFLVSVLAIVFGGILLDSGVTALGAVLLVSGILLVCGAGFLCCGFKVLGPNEAVVLTLFGKYYGTIKADGFYWVNPFCACINPGNSRTVTTNANGTTIPAKLTSIFIPLPIFDSSSSVENICNLSS